MGRMSSTVSRATPSEMPRLGLGSASTATTVCPRRARCRASDPAIMLLPDPPFPQMAILIGAPSLRDDTPMTPPAQRAARATLVLRTRSYSYLLCDEQLGHLTDRPDGG
jgi:hypothetical protein